MRLSPSSYRHKPTDWHKPQGHTHATQTEYLQIAPETMKAVVALETHPGQQRAGDFALSPGEDPRLADQRLRLLHPHAHPGRARPWRDRRAAVPARRLARIAALHRARARRPRLDRIADPHRETHAPDEVYEEVRKHFSEVETVKLTMLIGMINPWNRLAISIRSIHPVKKSAAASDVTGRHRRRQT